MAEFIVNGSFLTNLSITQHRYFYLLLKYALEHPESGNFTWTIVIPEGVREAAFQGITVIEKGAYRNCISWTQKYFARYCTGQTISINPSGIIPVKRGKHTLLLTRVNNLLDHERLSWLQRLMIKWNHVNARKLAAIWTTSLFARYVVCSRLKIPVTGVEVIPPSGSHLSRVQALNPPDAPEPLSYVMVPDEIPELLKRYVSDMLKSAGIKLYTPGSFYNRNITPEVYLSYLKWGLENAVTLINPHEHEPIALLELEAIESGCPVISTLTGAAGEYVKDGPLFSPLSTEVVQLIERLMQDPVYRIEVNQLQRSKRVNLDWHTISGKWLTWLEAVATELNEIFA